MKIISNLLVVFLTATVSCHADATITAAQDSRPLEITAGNAAQIERHSVALLISCDYEASSDVATEARWQSALGASHTYVVFTDTRKVMITCSTAGVGKAQEIAVKEILIPFSRDRSPDYILVRVDGRVRAFAKYNDREALLALQKSLSTR